MERTKLKRLYLNGYKSFGLKPFLVTAGVGMDSEEELAKIIDFGDITVLLGANGAGKSNLVSFFRMVNAMVGGSLQEYVQREGSSAAMLHYGPQETPTMQGAFEFAGERRRSRYTFTLAHAQPDTLILINEAVDYAETHDTKLHHREITSGQRESRLKEQAQAGDRMCKDMLGFLARCRVYQFDNTSSTAAVRNAGYIEDAYSLLGDAGNLAAFLRAMRESHPRYYRRIEETVQLVFREFGEFVLEPSKMNEKMILLNWRGRERPDHLFGPHQLSDGTLRFMAMAALFLQPPENLPSVIVIDEPELGLHPYAITVLSSIVRTACHQCQVVLSTQSTRLVDEFDLSDVVIVEYDARENSTCCSRPDPEAMKDWIARYSVSELWEKNVLGGRP